MSAPSAASAASAPLKLKIRGGPTGDKLITSGLTKNSTLAQLRLVIQEQCGVKVDEQECQSSLQEMRTAVEMRREERRRIHQLLFRKYSPLFTVSTTYPPPVRVLSADPSTTLGALKIQSSDILLLKQVAAPPLSQPVPTTSAAAAASSSSSNAPTVRRPTSPAKPKPASLDELSSIEPLNVIAIPNDNSCLFNSVGLLMEGAHSPDLMMQLRQIVASVIETDQEKKFDEAFLGSTKEEYAQTMLKTETWGGGIELSLLAEYYNVEIAALDVETCHQYIFGTGDTPASRKKQRIYTVYYGVHYDALEDRLPNGQTRRIFSPDDSHTEQRALKTARILQSQGAFTNVTKFTLRCSQCQTGFTGAVEAQTHAKSTGHTQFEEYTK